MWKRLREALHRVALNPVTGKFFDGTGFNTDDIEKAKRIPDAISAEDFRAIWDCPVRVESEHLFKKFGGITMKVVGTDCFRL